MLKVLSLITLFLLYLPTAGQTPRAIEDRVLTHLASIEKWSNYGDSTDETKLEKANAALKSDLLRFGQRPAVLSYSFPRLKGKMYVTTSTDRKFRIYSWDQQTGGTMHDFDSVLQFVGGDGKVHAATAPVGGFVHDIFQVKDPTGAVYLAVSTFIASGSLLGETISAFKIAGARIDSKVRIIRTTKGLQNSVGFEYDFSSVMDRDERPVKLFTFNEARRSFSFPVVIEDEETPQGRVTNKLITYRFDGKYFVKVN